MLSLDAMQAGGRCIQVKLPTLNTPSPKPLEALERGCSRCWQRCMQKQHHPVACAPMLWLLCSRQAMFMCVSVGMQL